MWPNPQETAYLVTFTEETLNGKLYICAGFLELRVIRQNWEKCWFNLLPRSLPKRDRILFQIALRISNFVSYIKEWQKVISKSGRY